jgi:hypothetical protein
MAYLKQAAKDKNKPDKCRAFNNNFTDFFRMQA